MKTDDRPCEASGRDPWRCVTHDSAWDLTKRCQVARERPEPRKRP